MKKTIQEVIEETVESCKGVPLLMERAEKVKKLNITREIYDAVMGFEEARRIVNTTNLINPIKSRIFNAAVFDYCILGKELTDEADDFKKE